MVNLFSLKNLSFFTLRESSLSSLDKALTATAEQVGLYTKHEVYNRERPWGNLITTYIRTQFWEYTYILKVLHYEKTREAQKWCSSYINVELYTTLRWEVKSNVIKEMARNQFRGTWSKSQKRTYWTSDFRPAFKLIWKGCMRRSKYNGGQMKWTKEKQ